MRRLALALCMFLLVSTAVRAAEQPNIVFIFADDQCYETLHSLGHPVVETPNLDRLVDDGITFTHAYNQGSWSGAVCVASRTMLNTGRFLWKAARFYKDNTVEKERQAGRFWSEHMKVAGYTTYMTGKWHVKAKSGKAFDFQVHERPGMPNQTEAGYNRPIEGQPDPWCPWDTKFEGFWKGGKHWSEVLGDDSLEFLKHAQEHDKPFFMYLAFNAPHDPRQSPKEYVEKYPLDKIDLPENFLPEYPYNEAMKAGRTLRDERLAPFPRTPYAVKVNRQEYYAIITHMDAQVGRILDAIQATGKADNTYVFFTARPWSGRGPSRLDGQTESLRPQHAGSPDGHRSRRGQRQEDRHARLLAGHHGHIARSGWCEEARPRGVQESHASDSRRKTSFPTTPFTAPIWTRNVRSRWMATS